MYRESVYLLLRCLILGVVITSVTRADLVGWWMFDEGSGTVAVDSSDNGNDGVLQGAPHWVDGIYDAALEFDGYDYVNCSNQDILNFGTNDWAITAWIKTTQHDTGTIFANGGDYGGGIRFTIATNEANLDGITLTTDDDRSKAQALGATLVTDGQWHHVAAMREETEISVFVDGSLDGTSTLPAGYNLAGTSQHNALIGAITNHSDNTLTKYYIGLIDDVRIYNGALTLTELQAVMKGTVGYPYVTGPDPVDGAIHKDTWVTLKWSPGDSAVSHDVYFGENYDEVNTGTGGTFRGNQLSNNFTAGLPGHPYPNGLVPGTTYYWRIDEVQADGVTRHRGSVWSFSVPSGEAYSPYPSDGAESVSTDVTLNWVAGRGAETHIVYFGDDTDAVEDAVDGIPQTLSRYCPGELEFDKTYYWRVDEFDGTATYKGDVWSFTTMSAEAFLASSYYVNGGNRVANDGNPGTEARPFRTIGRGVQSLQPGDTLLIKAGIYRETVILTKSGSQENPIQIRAYPGDEGKVIINAAEPVTDWRKCAGSDDCDGNPYWEHIYVADVAALVQSHPKDTFAVRQVFQYGQLLERSRYPDAGWNYPTAVVDPTKTFTDSSLSKPDGYFVGSVCHIKTRVWQIDPIPIIDFSRGTVTLATSPPKEISTQFGYYITSIVGEINEEGEWAYDPAQKKIFLWPKGDVAEGVEFTYRRYGVRTYDGVGWNIVRGLTVRYAYNYGIYLYMANNMRVENNAIEHTFDCGIYAQAAQGKCENNHISNNAVRYSSATGIAMDRTAWNNTVEGNYVYATGTDHYGGDLMNGQSHAVYISGPGACVYNNRIDYTGYTALCLSGGMLGREISYNYITNVCLALSDGGGIYMASFYEEPEKDYIHHNIIADVIGCLSMDRKYDKGLPVTIERYSGSAPGIYIDEEGNNRIIEKNTVIRSHMAGVLLHWARSNLIQKNTLYGNGEGQVYLSGKYGARTALVDNAVLENIMFATNAQQKTLKIGMNYDDVRFGQSDDNYFYNPYADRNIYVSRYVDVGNGNIQVIQEDMTLDGWRAMSGYDTNSKEFSYLDQNEDITINTRKDSRIVYNASLDVISIDLEAEKYCDVDGNKIYGSVSLQPFESKILIKCDFEIP